MAKIKEEGMLTAICPKCGKEYRGYPAQSRADSTVYICPDCGTREALTEMGISPEEQEQILLIIHAHERA